MRIMKVELYSDVLAEIVGIELYNCDVCSCVLGSAVVAVVTKLNVNDFVNVYHSYGGHLIDANDFDINQVK